MRSLTRITGGVLLLALALVPRAAHAAVTGSIEGTVTDQATAKRLAGVTVTVTSPALQGEQTEFTDADGHYIITELPPGEYLVRFYFSNINVERPGVFLQADKTLSVNVAIPTQKAEVKTYRITEKAPTVDVGNTQQQTQITSEFVRNTPVRGRTYAAVLSLAPGAATAQGEGPSVSFSGATGPENNFLIDGVNTTDPAFGLLGTQLTQEFIGETELITGGYNAEYGRATGGVVNVITKAGSNQFHGDLWFYTTPYQLDPLLVGRSGEAIATRTKTQFNFDVGFDLGGPIVKDKVWFYVGFQPTFTTTQFDRYIRERQMSNLPTTMMGGTYQGDLDVVSCPKGLDTGFCNTKGLLAPGYVTAVDPNYTTRYTRDDRLYNWIAKLNFQLNPNNSLVVQYIGSPSTQSGALGPDRDSVPTFNSQATTFLGSRFENTHDALIHYVSKLADRRLQLDFMAGYHYDSITNTPGAGGTDAAATYQFVEPLQTFETNITPCKTFTTASGVSFNPCPVQNYTVGGFGFLDSLTVQRVSAMAAATYFARLGGTHAIKVGFDFEDNFYTHSRNYTGGAFYDVAGSPADTTITVAGQFGAKSSTDLNAPAIDKSMTGFTATTQTLNYGAYLRDSYNVSFIPGLTINAGVRYEAQQVKGADGTIQIGIYDNWAPRIGAIYDFTQKGRGKLFASYGWFYESIPLDINDRSFSGEGDIVGSPPPSGAGCKANAAGIYDLTMCHPAVVTNGGVSGGTYSSVSPGLKGQYSEEVVAGIQYDVGLDLVLGATYIHRDLGRIIEDMSPDASIDFIIANPGSTPDPGLIKDLQSQIQATNDPMKKQTLTRELALYQQTNVGFPKPVRNYDAMVLTATKRLSHNFLLLASYTYSRTLGNYPGLFQASNGQRDPNITTQYDFRELLINRFGPLPNDRPHILKVQGSYFVPFGSNTMVFGLAFNMQSGVPIEVLGGNPIYGGSPETFILPRGSGGRTPTLTSFDLHVSYRRQLSRIFSFEAYADVFNLFDQQEVTQVDQLYTSSNVNPIENGKVADLVNLKQINGNQPLLNPNYGHAVTYQQPLSMRFGVRLSF
ncbi:MAG TPA: TonB-dependent receptor [Polyangia bacterium]|nr:TonB-dependent receptor [Polyangia bacterium]